MKSIVINKKFGKVITLILGSKSQDIMLINETSPAMVRFLGEDNRFRTFQLTEQDKVTEIKLTKSDDPEASLDVLFDFINSCDGTTDVSAESAKAADKKKKEQQAEAIAHREALHNPKPKQDEDAPEKRVKLVKKVKAKPETKPKAKKKKTTKKSKKKTTKKAKK